MRQEGIRHNETMVIARWYVKTVRWGRGVVVLSGRRPGPYCLGLPLDDVRSRAAIPRAWDDGARPRSLSARTLQTRPHARRTSRSGPGRSSDVRLRQAARRGDLGRPSRAGRGAQPRCFDGRGRVPRPPPKNERQTPPNAAPNGRTNCAIQFPIIRSVDPGRRRRPANIRLFGAPARRC